MAKKSQQNRDNKRKALIGKFADRRAELRKRLGDPEVPYEEKIEIQEAFAKLPRNSCPTRLNRRCESCRTGGSCQACKSRAGRRAARKLPRH